MCSVKKGSVLVTRMESITTYKNQHGQPRSGKKFMTFTPFGSSAFLKYSKNTAVFQIIIVLITRRCLVVSNNDDFSTVVLAKL